MWSSGQVVSEERDASAQQLMGQLVVVQEVADSGHEQEALDAFAAEKD